MDSLRASRSQTCEHEVIVAGADPMNLAGIVVPGERVPAVPGRSLRFRNGSLIQPDGQPAEPIALNAPPVAAPAQALNLF